MNCWVIGLIVLAISGWIASQSKRSDQVFPALLCGIGIGIIIGGLING